MSFLMLSFSIATSFSGEGFNDRTGRQVISRMLIVYHPSEKSRYSLYFFLMNWSFFVVAGKAYINAFGSKHQCKR